MSDTITRAVILSACPVSRGLRRYIRPGDCIVDCDAGYRNAEALGVRPDLIVGDFDSAPRPPQTGHTIVLPHVKDDTDTHYAARWLLEQGAGQVVMLGRGAAPAWNTRWPTLPPGCIWRKTAWTSAWLTSAANCATCCPAGRLCWTAPTGCTFRCSHWTGR